MSNEIIPLSSALTEVKPKALAIQKPAGKEVAAKALALILGSYRTSFDEPKVFVRQAVGALEDYPEQVLADLTNSKIGILRECKFAPSIAELISWCDKRQAELIEQVSQTPAQRAALWHAFERDEPWAITFFRLKGVTK